jgi:retron-type reverse transcriptase
MTKLGNNLQYMEIINMGTCGIIFLPLLANIAFHGMETTLRERALKAHPKKLTMILVRYVNNFVVLHQSRDVIE